MCASYNESLECTRAAKAAALEAGFDLVGCASPRLHPQVEDALKRWLDRGYAGTMAYLTRDGLRRARLTDRWPHVKTVMALGLNYYSPRPAPPPSTRAGRVAAYAYGRDYHRIIGQRLTILQSALIRVFGSDRTIKGYTDTGPILERAFAVQAGIGFMGKNTNVISQLFGSWIFLAVLLLDVELDFDAPVSISCGTCTKCLDACPTQAFPDPYVLNATRCIAYHTIESHAPVPQDFQSRFGDWVFGCDVCQDVCPFNRKFSTLTSVDAFRPGAGAGAWLDLDHLGKIESDEAFREQFHGSPIKRDSRLGIKRFT